MQKVRPRPCLLLLCHALLKSYQCLLCRCGAKPESSSAAAPKEKKAAKKEVKEEDACLDYNTILTNPRWCAHCGLRQPTAQSFKPKTRKAIGAGGGDDAVALDDLLERVDEKLEELRQRKEAGAGKTEGGNGGDGASGEEAEALKKEVAKWKGLFQAAAADVDEKDELLAQQMEHIAELTAQLEGEEDD